MKTFTFLRFSLVTTSIAVITLYGCQKSYHQDIRTSDTATIEKATTTVNSSLTGRQTQGTGACNSYAYTIVLESHTPLINGASEWIWSVTNPNPGNGSNGTVQNLSHWGMQFGSCFSWSSVTGAAYSADGTNWTSFIPVFQSDPSQTRMTTPVLKFDFGTTGGNKSYYKLILNQDYQIQPVPGYYKSGANTGCCTFFFAGIGCDGGDIPR